MAKVNIGGQAVLEGVMMQAPERRSIAVRRAIDHKIVVSVQEIEPAAKKHKILGWPVVRGVAAFVGSLSSGMHTISLSAKMLGDDSAGEEPSRFETWLAGKLGKRVDDIVMGLALVIAAAMACGFFVVLPSLAAQWFKLYIPGRMAVNLLEGLVRLLIFMGYILSVSRVKEIGRVFRYHGAEHKTVHMWEHDEELIPENAKKYPVMHPRCGTAFLLIVMLLSILLFSAFGWDLTWYTRILSRLVLLPVVAGVSYEVLRVFGKYDNAFVRVLRWPGMALQRITAKEPDDSMLEVAIVAMKAALGLPHEGLLCDADGVVPAEAEPEGPKETEAEAAQG
ncbi:MAG: DUF1385 domain-containing protein [Christensenellaceae bacterium]|jgi:uncharacterized protein YqhQ|nr:DUF1385 domain-containing protein [Christensenellaceae bacterium]